MKISVSDRRSYHAGQMWMGAAALALLLGASWGYSQPQLASIPSLTSAELWKPDDVPFSFKYNGKESAQFLTAWKISKQDIKSGDAEVRRYSYKDPATLLKVTAEVRTLPTLSGHC